MVIGIHSMLELEITFTLHIYKCVCICILKFSFMEFECLSCQYIVIGVLILNKEGHITFCFPLAPIYCAPLFSVILQFFKLRERPVVNIFVRQNLKMLPLSVTLVALLARER